MMGGGGSSQEQSLLEGLLTLAGDPAKMAARLEELRAATEAHDKRKEESVLALAQSELRASELAALADDLAAKESLLERMKEKLQGMAALLDVREDEINAKCKQLEEDKAAQVEAMKLEKRDIRADRAEASRFRSEVAARERAVAAKEAELATIAEALAKNAAEVEAEREAVTSAMSQMRSIVGAA